MEARRAREIRDETVEKKLEPIFEAIEVAAKCGESVLIIKREDLTDKMIEVLKDKAYTITFYIDTEMKIVW